MTHKEKAIELLEKYSAFTWTNPLSLMKSNAKHLAITVVDDILAEWNKEHGRTAKQSYWMGVKNEIERL